MTPLDTKHHPHLPPIDPVTDKPEALIYDMTRFGDGTHGIPIPTQCIENITCKSQQQHLIESYVSPFGICELILIRH